MNTIKVTLTLPVRGDKEHRHIDFDFQGAAEGIKRATGTEVNTIYGLPGEHEVLEVVWES